MQSINEIIHNKQSNEKNCLIYCRVSTPKQAKEGESLEDQERICRGIAEKKDLNIIPKDKIWKEPYTGSKDKRPVLDEMFNFVNKLDDEITCLIIRDIDRLTRGGVDHYQKIKKRLTKHGIELVDSCGLIQPNINSLEHTGFDYSWSKYSPSGMTENLLAENAKDERRKILTRLIGAEINLVQQGYHVGNSTDGFETKKIITSEGKKKTIQVPDPKREKFFIEMFKMRASGRYTDEEIVEKINALGFKSRTKNKWDKTQQKIIGKTGGNPLTVKQLQRTIKRPIYCGVLTHKWTADKPIKAQYSGLVDVETFNQANRGKIGVKASDGASVEVLYDQDKVKYIKRRQKLNPLFPYKFILCPHCKKPFLGSSPKGKSGKGFPSYHCARGHKYLGVNKESFENSIKEMIEKMQFNMGFFEVFERVLIDTFRRRQKELTSFSSDISSNLSILKSEKKDTLKTLIKTKSEIVRKGLEEEIEKIEKEIEQTQSQRNEIELNEFDVSNFIKYAKHLMEHLEEMLLQTENLKQKQALFELVFDEMPNYQQILNGTPKLSFIFQLSQEFEGSKSLNVVPRGIEPLFSG